MAEQKSVIEIWNEETQKVQYWDGEKYVDDIEQAFTGDEDVVCRVVPEAEESALINVPYKFRLCTATNGERKFYDVKELNRM